MPTTHAVLFDDKADWDVAEAALSVLAGCSYSSDPIQVMEGHADAGKWILNVQTNSAHSYGEQAAEHGTVVPYDHSWSPANTDDVSEALAAKLAAELAAEEEE